MQIEFNLTEDSINEMEAVDYEAFERAQDGDFKLYRIRPAIARFMVDGNNKPIPYNQALKISEKMKIKECMEFVKKFFELTQTRAVPNGNGSQSESPIEVSRMDSPSLVG